MWQKQAKKFLNTLKIIAVALVVLLGMSYLQVQAAFVNPTGNPPSGSAKAIPIHLSDKFQDKAGEFRANKIDVKNAICLNAGLNPGDCITAWPSGVGTLTATCHMEERRLHLPAKSPFPSRLFWDTGVSSMQYPTCDMYLTPEAKAAGWGATGGDNCVSIPSSDCYSNSAQTACVYARLVCDSNVNLQAPTFSTSTYTGTPFTIPLNSPAL